MEREYSIDEAEEILVIKTGLKLAIEFAEIRHRRQLYGNLPFIEHIREVYDNVVKMKDSILSSFPEKVYEDSLIVSNLHDTVENNVATLGEIRSIFGDEIVEAVDLISKKEGQSYFEYLERMNHSIGRFNPPLAMLVKLADLHANMSNTIKTLSYYGERPIDFEKLTYPQYEYYKKAFRRKEKYSFALYYVQSELKNKTGFLKKEIENE